MIRPGQRVRIVAPYSLFHDQRGTVVTAHGDYAHVILDSHATPIRFGVETLKVIDEEAE